MIPESRFREVFDRVEAFIERRWEIPVVIRDVADPFTGDLDGERIEVDYDQSCEDAPARAHHRSGAHREAVGGSAECRARLRAHRVPLQPAALP